jgi:hypothetical protein
MPRWHDLAVALAMIAVAAPAAADDMPTLAPAAQSAILDGAKACLGATLDPDTRPTRFADWTSATPEQRQGMKTDGTVVTRANVMIAYKPGKDGGCVVMATSDAAFDATTFYPQLTAIVGATVAKTDKPAPVDLPDGELLVPVITAQTAAGTPNVILVFANRAGQYGKKGK